MKKFIVLALPVLLICGCGEIKGKLLVMEANMMQSRSRYNQSISSYSEGLEYASSAAYAEYGLGLVYLMLGEDDAAAGRFEAASALVRAEPDKNYRELNYRIHYNMGILFFHAGNYGEAVSEFRKALETDPARIEAKRNLELSLLSIKQENISAAASSALDIAKEQSKANTLFDYLRQKEMNQWKSRESPEDQTVPGLDY